MNNKQRCFFTEKSSWREPTIAYDRSSSFR